MRRAGIYFFFDKDGIVDRYVPYYIRELHRVVDYIVVVVNGKLTPEGRKTLAEVSDDMFVRENKGFDAWAYKDAIEYIGWDELRNYDELVITNFTVYGPVYPFQEIFDQMEKDPCDFWGMFRLYEDKTMKNYMGVPLKWGYRPGYIGSNFLVFKRDVLHSYELKHLLESLHEIRSYVDSIVYFEMSISKELTDAGFTFSTADDGAFELVYPSATVYGAYDMIAEHRVPIIRKKAFFDPNCLIDYCTDVPRRVMQYIDEQTDYDNNLILENLLRTNNLYDLKNWFNWNIILPLDYSRVLPEGKRIAVIFHTYYDDIMGQYLHNIEAFPERTDFYFTTDTEEKKEALEELLEPYKDCYHIEYRIVDNRGRDVSALLVGCRDVVLDGGYDLVCFMHDKKGIGLLNQYACVGQSFSDCCFENTAASADYVNNVIELFDRQPRLGLAVPPPPRNANYYKVVGGSWTINYANTEKLLKELGITVPISKQKPPVSAIGSVFWFRPEALRPLFEREWKIENFAAEPMPGDGTISNAIERAHGLIAQSQGYYTSIIMNSVYAEQEVTRMTDIAHTYVDMTLQYAGPRQTLKQATDEFTRILQRQKQQGVSQKNTAHKKQTVQRSAFKSFVRGICPIGLWNLIRRVRCAAAGGVYVEPYVQRGLVKSVVRACTPRFIWDAMRKAKCRKNGWVFVED